MTNLHSFESRLKTIEQLIKKLDQTKLSAEELAELVENAREIYDRSVILQYKSYEEKVFGQHPVTKEETPVSEQIVEEVLVEEPHVEPMTETAPEEEMVEETAPTAFDFSLFDEPVAEVEAHFSEEPEMEEHVSITQTSSDEGGIHEEKIIMVQETISVNNDAVSALASQFARDMSQVESGYNAPRLETLVGTFGLNERLQFINELFHGSSEEFAEAIKELDSLSGLDEARQKVAHIAIRNQWDKESETVADFLNKMKRRYA